MTNPINILDAITELNKDLTSKAKIAVQMRLRGVWQIIKVSNYMAKYQSERAADLILIEGGDLAFTVSIWDAHETVGQQIRNAFNK